MNLGRGITARLMLFVALLSLGGWATCYATAQADAPEALAPSVLSDLADARSLVREGRQQDAIALLRRADDASQGRCVPCLDVLAEAFAGLGAHRNVADVTRRLIALQPDESVLAPAYRRLGMALLAAGKADPAALGEAAAAFRSELELTEDTASLARYYLGETLIRQGKHEEGVAELKAFLDRNPTAEEARAARQYVADPSCVLDPCVPDLSVLTREGELLSLRSYRGRVLVLLFWTAWAGSSDHVLAEFQRVARRFSDKPVDFLAVSSASDRDAFLQATASWEYLPVPVSDPENALTMSLDIATWPAIVVVDPSGKILDRRSGWNNASGRDLQRVLRDAVKAVGS